MHKKLILIFMMIGIMVGMPLHTVWAEEQDPGAERTAEGSDYILNYIYMNDTEVCQYDTQTIGVQLDGIEEASTGIQDILLGYEVNGQRMVCSYSDCEDSMVLFELPADVTGTYSIRYLDVVREEDVVHMDFASEDIGIPDASYEVVEDYLGLQYSDEVQEVITDGALSEHDIQLDVEQMIPVGADGKLIVVIDPGHCPIHPGAAGNGLREEVLTLKIANYCREELEKYSNVTVYMTREGSSCPDPSSSAACLRSRSAYAASVHANVLVSIHIDAGSATKSGAMVIVAKKGVYRDDLAEITQDLGDSILAELTKLGLNSRGLYVRMSDSSGEEFVYPNGATADYYNITRNCVRNGIPGIIVEHCFISNPSDCAAYLSSEEKLKALGVADATGIAEYYNLNKNGNVGEVLYDTSEEPYQVEDHNISDFVALLYDRVLDRTPAKSEVSYWVRRIEVEGLTGAQLTGRFVNSKEFQLRDYSDEEYIEKLYEVYLGRASEPEGKSHWLEVLANGCTRLELNNRFGKSKEFELVCGMYGMEQGEYKLQYHKLYPEIAEFVTPYYLGFLNREPDEEGLEHWCKFLIQGGDSAELTRRFVNSTEYKMNTRTADEFVEGLYHTYLDRDSDPEGKEHWMAMLPNMSYEEQLRVIKGFHGSKEYKLFCDRYGISVGTL